MKVKFNIKNLTDSVVAINGEQFSGGVQELATNPITSAFFHFGTDENGLPQLRAVKYGKQSLVLTLNDGSGDYTASAIRLFGARPRPHKC